MEVAKAVVPPVVGSSSQGTSVRSQRATRHKKINFLEMLRGDSTGSVEEVTSESADKKYNKQKSSAEVNEGKKKRKTEERRVKVVHYKIETDSSEETDSVESDYGSSYDTDTTSESEILVLKKAPPPKQRKISAAIGLLKSSARTKVKIIPPKDPLKVKLGNNKSKSGLATSTPVSVQVTGKKSVGVASPGTSPVHGDKKLRAPITGVRASTETPLVFGKKPSANTTDDEHCAVVDSDNNSSQIVSGSLHHMNSDSTISSDIFPSKPASLEIAEKDLKVSPTLPDEILETPSESYEKMDVDCSTSEDQNSSQGQLNNNEISEKSLKNSITESQLSEQTESPFAILKRKEAMEVRNEETALRIIHRDASPLAEPRSRSQLGEVFVDRYHNKKSVCVRCYTCRKMMTVDSFLRHLHDVASGGLIAVTSTRTVDISDSEITDRERKTWETFQRKKELFDNNQIPSPELVTNSLVYSLASEDSNHSNPDTGLVNESQKKPSGPRIIKTPVSPTKKSKIVRKNESKTLITNKVKVAGVAERNLGKRGSIDSVEGVRSSSRKRKVKQLYPFEEYSFAKFPRLMKNAEDSKAE